MEKLDNLARSCERNFLWPSIADAVDTFLRRRACGAGSYERIWRLIHIWEAVEITLSLAVVAKLCQELPPKPSLLKCREFFYGTSWDQVTNTIKTAQGAANGSIDQWINILFEVSKTPCEAQGFMAGVCRLLQSDTIDLRPLVLAWRNACDVPLDAQSQDRFPVRQAMRHVNTFRNRFAHVPFPHDPLDHLAASLEDVTEQLFSVQPVPCCHCKEGLSSPLTGMFKFRSHTLKGTMASLANGTGGDSILFQHPSGADLPDSEQWDAGPFVHIDSMMRPHVLTRVSDEGIPEYTRYRAEANAVVIRRDLSVHDALGQPRPAEFIREPDAEPCEEQEEQGGETTPVTMSGAIDAMRQEKFDLAIDFFRLLTENQPDYHIGWLRLGHTEREKALRVASTSQSEAEDLLGHSAEHLGMAAEHRDVEYQAQALYERSKTFFHLAKLGREASDNFSRSLADAEKACELSNDPKFWSWFDFLTNHDLARSVEEGVTNPEAVR